METIGVSTASWFSFVAFSALLMFPFLGLCGRYLVFVLN